MTLMFNTSSGHQKIAEAIQQMWKDNLGVDVKVVNQEWKVYLETTKDPMDTPQIFRMGWCLDYPDANNFDREVCRIRRLAEPDRGRRLQLEERRVREAGRSSAAVEHGSWRSASSCTPRPRKSWSSNDAVDGSRSTGTPAWT